MGQFRKHRAACFISLLLKTETGTWHLCDYPTCWKGTRNEGNESLLLVVSAQICARSTDILHGNYPRLRGNLPLQRISSPTIIHEKSRNCNTFAIFFYTLFHTKFTKNFRLHMVILHKSGYKITIFIRFCMFFQAIFSLKRAQIRLSVRKFCDVLTKMTIPSNFHAYFLCFFFLVGVLFILCS